MALSFMCCYYSMCHNALLYMYMPLQAACKNPLRLKKVIQSILQKLIKNSPSTNNSKTRLKQ